MHGKYDESSRIIIEWHIGYMLLSYVTCLIGTYSALDMLKEARANSINAAGVTKERSNVNHYLFILISSFSFGFAGIWSMHFIGMEAAKFNDLQGSYNTFLMILSGIGCVFFTFIALSIAMKHDFKELNMLTRRTKQFDKIIWDNQDIKWLAPITRDSIFDVILGGFFLAVGVGVMHYLGMSSLYMNAGKYYHWWLILIVVIVAVLVCIVGVALLVYITGSIAEIVSAGIIALAACGLHYGAMYSVSFYIVDGYINDKSGIRPSLLTLTIIASLVQYLVTGFARYRSTRLTLQLVEATDNLLDSLCDDCRTTKECGLVCEMTNAVDIVCFSPKSVKRGQMAKSVSKISRKDIKFDGNTEISSYNDIIDDKSDEIDDIPIDPTIDVIV